MNSQSAQAIGSTKLKPAATGHVDRYISVFVPGAYSSGSGQLTIDEAKELRKNLAEAIKIAGE